MKSDEREGRIRKEIEKIGIARLTKFILHPETQETGGLFISGLKHAIENGESLEQKLVTPFDRPFGPEKQFGYFLSVDVLDENSFRIVLGCQVAPTAGDYAVWQVDFRDDGEIESISWRTRWVS